MDDPTDVERIRNEVRHGFAYTLPRTALNDVETLLEAYDREKLRRKRYQVALQSAQALARKTKNDTLMSLLRGLDDIYAEE